MAINTEPNIQSNFFESGVRRGVSEIKLKLYNLNNNSGIHKTARGWLYTHKTHVHEKLRFVTKL